MRQPTDDSPPPFLFPVLALCTVLLLYRMPPREYAAYCFAGAPVLQWARRPRRHEWFATALLAPAIAVGYHIVHGARDPTWLASIVVGFGAASILVVGFASSRARGEDRLAALRDLAALGTMPMILFGAVVVLTLTADLHPFTYDRILTAVDRSLGFDPSFLAGRALRTTNALRWVGWQAYDVLPLAVTGVAAIRWRRFGPTDSSNILLATLVAGQLALVLFQLVPACGPVYAWEARFPFSSPSDAELSPLIVSATSSGFRNALPSMHMVGAIMVAWTARPLGRWWRALALVLLGLTIVTTLGTGQHYLVDLVAAVPLAVTAEVVVRRSPRWRMVAGVSFVTLLAWMGVLRWWPAVFTTVPGLTWAAVAATVISMPILARSFLNVDRHQGFSTNVRHSGSMLSSVTMPAASRRRRTLSRRSRP